MRKVILFFIILFYSSVYAQTYTISKIESSENIKINRKGQLTITGVTDADKNKYFISHESDPDKSLKKGTMKNAGELFFDISKELGRNPSGLLLVLPNGIKKSFVTTDNNDTKNNNSTANGENDFTGIAFWDAKYIYGWCINPTESSKDKVKSVIDKYSLTIKDWNGILNNPFFAKSKILAEMLHMDITTLGEDKGSGKGESGASGLLGSMSGLDVTKYVQAFADFLRDRIKEELTIAYLEKLKKLIDTTPELQYMLPKTRNIFLTNDAFSIPSMGAIYKAAFAEDMENLVPNFEKMVYALDAYKNLRESESFVGFLVAYHFADMSAKSYHPAEILKKLNSSYPYQQASAPVITYSVAVLNMFSQHMLNIDGKVWVGRNELRNIARDEVYIFLGLLYEKYPDIFNARLASGANTLKNILLNLIEKSEAPIVDKLYNFLLIANTIDERIKDFKQSADKPAVVLTYFINNADALKDLLDFALELTGAQPINTAQYYKWKNVFEYSLEAAKGIRENNMGKVGGNVIAIINELIPGDLKWKRDLANIIKLITDLVNAETSADIKAVLERNAAPVRSYRVARTYPHSVSIASYPGLYIGHESDFKNDETHAFAFGVTAPIGIAFHQGNLKDKKAGRSNSLFINLFDIGAALSYRWGNDTLDLPEKITLGQIFSPGIFYVNGWKNSPLAWKFGFQYAPQLRSIKNNANVIAQKVGVLRFTLGLSVDIPVFLLSGKPD